MCGLLFVETGVTRKTNNMSGRELFLPVKENGMKEIKNTEWVVCEMCGSEDCFIADGIAGMCNSCGNQFGDWGFYEDEDDDE